MAKLFQLNRFKAGPPIHGSVRSVGDFLKTNFLINPPTITGILVQVTRRRTESDQNLLLTLLGIAAVATPFVPEEDDWHRTPFVPARCSEATQNLLLTTLPITLPPFVKNNDNWARQQYVYTRTSEATQNTLILPTTLAPLVLNDDTFARQQYVNNRDSESTQNRLILPTTLAPLTSNDDTLIRLQYVNSRESEATQNLLLTTLATPVVVLPFEPTDWTRSTGLLWRRYEADQAAPQPLLATTAAPFKTLADWPAPPLVAGRVAEAVQNLLLATLSLVPGTPVRPFDWGRPAPLLTRQAEATQNLLTALLPTTLAPLTNDNDDWGERYQPTSVRVAEAVQNPLIGVLGLVAQPMPFQPEAADWSRTQWVPYRVVEATQNTLLTVLPSTLAPFAPFEWGHPWCPSLVRQSEDVQNLSLTLLPTTALTPNLHRLFIDVETGDIYYRLNATTPLILRVG